MRISDWCSDVCSSDRHQLHELHGIELVLAAVAPHRVQRLLEESGVGHAGNLDRVLERQEDALAGALLRRHLQEVLALEQHRAVGGRSEEHTSELQSLMRISYAVFRLNKKIN